MSGEGETGKMLALVCQAPGNLRLEHRPVPVRGPEEVLIRVRRVGICGTDMHIYRGTQPYLTYPRVFGHEMAGEVLEAPMDSGLHAGDVVYVMPYMSCGSCIACRQGRTNCCVNIQVLGVHCDGAMAEVLSVPRKFVFNATGIGLDDAAMIEFLAIGAHAVRRAQMQSEQRTLVVGAGPIGISVAWFARAAGARVTVVDQRPERLDVCRDLLDIEHAVLTSDALRDQLSDLTRGEFFERVFDATGSAAAMAAGFDYLAHGGTYVLVSIVQADICFSDPEFHKREATLLASRNATDEDFETVLQALRSGTIPTRALRTHRAMLHDLPNLLPEWLNAGARVIKAIVEC